MAARKRVLKNSVAGALETFASAQDVLVSPLTLTDREKQFFDMITDSRETSTWTASDLYNAAALAKVRRRVEELNDDLDAEGCTLYNERGNPISNPKFTALTQLMGQMSSLTRLLGLASSDRGLGDAAQQKRNRADASARAIIGKVAQDDLLA